MNYFRRARFFFICSILTLISFSCSKQEKFLGQTGFSTKIELKIFTSVPDAFVKVTIDDTTWKRIDSITPGSIQTVLSYSYSLPASGKSHLVINWKNGITIIDTMITLRSINTFYLLQLDDKKPPVFSTGFGDDAGIAPSEGKVNVRFFYKRDSADHTAPFFPSTILLDFYKLVGDPGNYYMIKDTSILVAEGQITPYIELPDCLLKENDKPVSLGYNIVDPQTGDTLQHYCFQSAAYKYSVIEILSDLKIYQTFTLNYYESVPGCNFGSPAEIYKMDLLFSSN